MKSVKIVLVSCAVLFAAAVIIGCSTDGSKKRFIDQYKVDSLPSNFIGYWENRTQIGFEAFDVTSDNKVAIDFLPGVRIFKGPCVVIYEFDAPTYASGALIIKDELLHSGKQHYIILFFKLDTGGIIRAWYEDSLSLNEAENWVEDYLNLKMSVPINANMGGTEYVKR
jgi:hypothetical protein